MGYPDWTPPLGSILNVTRQKPADPGSNADVTVNVDASQDWRLLLVKFVLTTSATAGNRQPFLRVFDAAAFKIFEESVGDDLGPNQTKTLSFAAGIGAAQQSTGAGSIIAPLPILPLDSSSVIRITYTNKAAGDRLSEVYVVAEVLQRQ